MGVPASHSLLRQVGGGVLVIVLSPLLLVAGICLVLYGLALHVAIWLWWCTRGKYVLLVYSNSPHWQAYFEGAVLPALDKRAVVLNWSERVTWPTWSLTHLAFRFFGGTRNFNPMAIVFRPGRFRRIFRFFGPLQEYKHGKPQAVERMTNEMLRLVPPATGSNATPSPKTGGV